MIMVRDIQDALTMKKTLSSLVRRSVTFNKDSKDILVDLMLLIEDLDNNIAREESLIASDELSDMMGGNPLDSFPSLGWDT